MELDVAVSCSAGTYIRALGRDLGEALGLGGYLTMLRRIRIGDFTETMPNIVTAHTESKPSPIGKAWKSHVIVP